MHSLRQQKAADGCASYKVVVRINAYAKSSCFTKNKQDAALRRWDKVATIAAAITRRLVARRAGSRPHRLVLRVALKVVATWECCLQQRYSTDNLLRQNPYIKRLTRCACWLLTGFLFHRNPVRSV